MKHILFAAIFLVLALYPLMVLANDQAEPPMVVVTTDREDAIYAVGETVHFTIALANADGSPVQGTMNIRYILSWDGAATELPVTFAAEQPESKQWIERKIQTWLALTDDQQVTLSYTVTQPGFLRLNAAGRSWNGQRVFRRGLGVAACAPQQINPVVTMPDAFDPFWQTGRERLAAKPLDVRQERLEYLSDEHQDTYLISFAGLNDTRIYGFLLVPRGQGPFPALVSVAPAGVGRPLENFVQGRLNSISQNQAICLYLGVHNVVPGRPPSDYPDYTNENWRITVDRPEDYFWYQAILGLDRAVTWLAERDDVDGRVVYKGNSQGGGVGLALTALNPHITAASINIPGFCDLVAFLDDGRAPGWGAGLEGHRRRSFSQEELDAAAVWLPYFDAVNFARRIRVPVLFAMGFLDITCPPTGIYAAYNQITAPKDIITLPRAGHGIHPFSALRQPWIRQQLGVNNDRPE